MEYGVERRSEVYVDLTSTFLWDRETKSDRPSTQNLFKNCQQQEQTQCDSISGVWV